MALSILESYLEHKVNNDKSSFYTLGVDATTLMEALLHAKKWTLPLKYLDLPIIQGPLRNIHFNGFFNKLSAWLSC